MQNNLSSIQSKNLYAPDYQSPAKALTHSPNKSLGGAVGGNSDVGMWMENNRYIFDAIMSGNCDLSQADQQQFMQWWSWSEAQLNAASSGFDPLSGGNYVEPGQPSAVLPEGAQLGPNGNAVFRTGTATTTYVPSSMPVDVLSDEFTLNVDVKVQDVVVEKTTDSRLNPATDVIKITVKDPYSTPAETVYYIHELDAKININTVGGAEDVTINGEFPNVTVGEYTAETADPANAQSSIAGQAVTDAEGKTVENAYYYEVEMAGDVIDFRTKQSGADSNEDHYVYGGANISVPVSSTVDVQKDGGPFVGADGKSYDFKVVVTHKDGSTDTFFLVDEPEFTHNINALSGNTAFDGVAMTDGKIPEAFEDLVTLNGSLDGASGSTKADHPEDTQPVEGVDAQFWSPEDVGAVYDSPVVDIHPTGTPSAIEIHANEVNITLDSMMDEIQQVGVNVQANGHTFYQLVIKFRDGATQTILVDKDAKININGGKIREDQVANLTKGEHPITLNGEAGEETEEVTWPSSDVVSKVPTTSGTANNNEALELANMINDAIRSGSWDAVLSKINGYSGQGGNNVIRKVITAIFLAAGSNADTFDQLMDMIPTNVRQAMKDKVSQTTGEASETQSGDQWNSAATAAKIGETLEE